jgi:hypothetical protein
MPHPSENSPTESQLERKIAYTDFILDILDSRYQIEEKLIAKATDISTSFRGVHCESFAPPVLLDDYIPPLSPVTFDIWTKSDDAGEMNVEQVELYPEDGAPLTLRRDGDFTILRQHDYSDILPADLLESTLRQLLPAAASDKATSTQMVEFLGTLSPESNYTISYEAEQADATHQIFFSKTETLEDSIDTIEVVKYAPHASGAQIGTRMHLTESINRRRQHQHPDHTDHELIIEALHRPDDSAELTVETVLNTNGRTVVIDTATRRHIQDITEVLSAVR